MRRRSLREYLDTKTLTPSKVYSKNDILCQAYYIFELTKYVESEEIFSRPQYFALIENHAKRAGLIDKFHNLLEKYICEMVESNMLTPKEPEDEGDLEEFVQDRQIRRMTAIDFNSFLSKNYARVVFLKEDVYSQLFYHLFLSENDEMDITRKYDYVSPRIIKKIAKPYELEFLKKEVNLSKEECVLLSFIYRKQIYDKMIFVCNQCTTEDEHRLLNNLGINKSTFDTIVNANGKLRKFGFINEDRTISPQLIECIDNQDFSLYFSTLINDIDLSKTYELNTFAVPEKNIQLHKKLLDSENPVSLLLYGAPGAGKTEYAKALVAACGKKAKIFRNENEAVKPADCLKKIYVLLTETNDDSVLIVDEADGILQSRNMDFFGSRPNANKGSINKMLENNKKKVIWIVNYSNVMDISTLRRFTLSHKFSQMSASQLEAITARKLKNYNLSENLQTQILESFNTYKVTGASVDNVVKVIQSIGSENEEEILNDVEIMLKENSLLLNGNPKVRKQVNANYDLSVLNTNISGEKILNMTRNALEFAKKNQNQNDANNGIRMLFYGVSGAGKTEFARYISEQLGKELLIKKASDILNKFVGGTEENIANAFSEAASNDQILLFDEADSFFSDRNRAEHSWERTQVNEFLTQMEDFPGILICTTNLRNVMDSALQRRFHMLVEFKSMKESGIRTMLNKYFPCYAFSNHQINELEDFETVTPGDFGALAGRIRFMNQDEINSDFIFEELVSLQKEKLNNSYDYPGNNNKIGFSLEEY